MLGLGVKDGVSVWLVVCDALSVWLTETAGVNDLLAICVVDLVAVGV